MRGQEMVYGVAQSALGRQTQGTQRKELPIDSTTEVPPNPIFRPLESILNRSRIMNKRIFVALMLVFALVVVSAPGAINAQTQPLAGKEVSFLTTFGGTELDAMNKSLDAFTNQTGILVTVESNRQSMPILRPPLAGGNPPDLALIPQPGALAAFVKAGQVKALVNKDGSAGLIDKKTLTDNYPDSILALGTVDGTVYGLLAKANSKSTIWYKPASLKALGMDVPKTWDDLMKIQAAYIAAGKTPWS